MRKGESQSSKKYKIVVCANLREEEAEYLKRQGCEVVYCADDADEEIAKELRDADGVVAGSLFSYDEGVFSASPRLRVIGRMGVGVDNIDLDAATRHHVQVVNTPQPIVEPVAEHALMMMLALARKLIVNDRTVRSGVFRDSSGFPGPQLRGKVLGVVGFGATGRRLAEIAHRGFGMDILYHDIVSVPNCEELLGAERSKDLQTLLGRSDFVSVHVDLNPSTQGLFNRQAFRAMKATAYFINCSRGKVVDETALLEALGEGRIAGAGLDVFAEEPPLPDHPLFRFDNVVLTPHRAGQGVESRIGCSKVAEDVIGVLKGENPRCPVN